MDRWTWMMVRMYAPALGGVGVGVAVHGALGNDPGESVARRDLRGGPLGPGAGHRTVRDTWAYRHREALALGSWTQRFGVRLRWLAWK